MSDQSQEKPRKPRNWPSITGTAEERASKGLNRLEDITRLISEWVWETDVEGRLTYASERVAEILGYTPMELAGKRFEDFGTFVSEEGVQIKPDLGEPFRELPFRTQSKEGVETLLLISSIPFYDRKTWKLEGYCGTSQDVTKLHEEGESLRISQDEAEKSNQAKSEFLSAMSHELRTPMNAILGFGQMLELNPKEPLTETQKSSVAQILKGGEHLLNLIDDVLDLAKIEAGKVEFSIEDVQIGAVIDDCLLLVKEMAASRDINITVPDSDKITVSIRADFTRLKQVLLNLMSNAIKYNRVGGAVIVGYEETPEGLGRISVTDTGDGIPENRQGELFKAFSRLGAENSGIEGTGIGLIVCKDLIELMGGLIGFESDEGEGSTFWFELPLGAGQTATADAIDGALVEGQLQDISGTMLYVEDNPSNLQLMEMIVSHIEGLSMLSAHTAELGIEIAKNKQPDVIVLDINLPGMSGLDAIKELKKHDATKNIPVLALSAAATKTDIDKGMEAGFLHYLTKPMDVIVVTDAIRDALDEKRKTAFKIT